MKDRFLYHWGIEGENYFLDENGKPYRTDEEVAKAQSDPDYHKNTGIDNYTGFQSMEQVLILRTDSRILQRRKNL